MLSTEQKGIFLALSSTIPLGISTVFYRYLLEFVNVETGIILWFIFQSFGFALFSIIFKKRKTYRKLFKNLKELTIFGMLTSGAVLTWCYGILYNGPVVTSFLLRFSDIFAVIFGFLLLKERPSQIEALGIFTAICGALLIGYNGPMQIVSIPLVSASLYALATLLVKVYVKKIDYFTLMGARSTYPLLFILPFTYFSGKIHMIFPSVALLYTFLGSVMGAFLGWLLFYKSLSLIRLTIASACKAINPFVTVLFSLVLLGMQLTVNCIVGGILISFGILLIGLKQKA
jgi:drug/metabolite transporter (DMT)-like permease